MVERLSQRSASGGETLPEVRNWSVDLLGGPEVFRDHPGGVELVGRPPKDPEVVWRPSRMTGSGRETLPEVQKWSGDPL